MSEELVLLNTCVAKYIKHLSRSRQLEFLERGRSNFYTYTSFSALWHESGNSFHMADHLIMTMDIGNSKQLVYIKPDVEASIPYPDENYDKFDAVVKNVSRFLESLAKRYGFSFKEKEYSPEWGVYAEHYPIDDPETVFRRIYWFDLKEPVGREFPTESDELRDYFGGWPFPRELTDEDIEQLERRRAFRRQLMFSAPLPPPLNYQ